MQFNPARHSAALLLALGISSVGCGGNSTYQTGNAGDGTDDGRGRIIYVSDWVTFANPYGNGQPNPALWVSGGVIAFELTRRQQTFVWLYAEDLQPDRGYGAKVYTQDCATNQGGDHYKNNPNGYPEPRNEIWLDFTTGNWGTGVARSRVNWVPRLGQARSVVLEDHPSDENGSGGTKLACINVWF